MSVADMHIIGKLKGIGRAFGIMALGLALATGANAAELSPDQTKAFQSVIRQYLLNNPEIIAEAIEALQKKRALAETNAGKAALRSQRSALFSDPDSPVAGDINGDVTVVEFFDYRCGVCKRVHPIVDNLMKGDRKLKRVYKDWPILGPESVFAARAALASSAQGKYLAFHDALMEARGRLNKNAVLKIAEKIGIDRQILVRDMDNAEITKILRRNYQLAEALKLNGTPSFVIGDRILKGGRDLETMRQIVADIRAGK
jgi:protein-disulfide isomerase